MLLAQRYIHKTKILSFFTPCKIDFGSHGLSTGAATILRLPTHYEKLGVLQNVLGSEGDHGIPSTSDFGHWSL